MQLAFVSIWTSDLFILQGVLFFSSQRCCSLARHYDAAHCNITDRRMHFNWPHPVTLNRLTFHCWHLHAVRLAIFAVAFDCSISLVLSTPLFMQRNVNVAYQCHSHLPRNVALLCDFLQRILTSYWLNLESDSVALKPCCPVIANLLGCVFRLFLLCKTHDRALLWSVYFSRSATFITLPYATWKHCCNIHRFKTVQWAKLPILLLSTCNIATLRKSELFNLTKVHTDACCYGNLLIFIDHTLELMPNRTCSGGSKSVSVLLLITTTIYMAILQNSFPLQFCKFILH